MPFYQSAGRACLPHTSLAVMMVSVFIVAIGSTVRVEGFRSKYGFNMYTMDQKQTYEESELFDNIFGYAVADIMPARQSSRFLSTQSHNSAISADPPDNSLLSHTAPADRCPYRPAKLEVSEADGASVAVTDVEEDGTDYGFDSEKVDTLAVTYCSGRPMSR